MGKNIAKTEAITTTLNYVRFTVAPINQLFVDILFNKRIIINYPERLTKKQVNERIALGEDYLAKFSCIDGVVSTQLIGNIFYVGVGGGGYCFVCNYEIPSEVSNTLSNAQFSIAQVKPGEIKLEINFDTLRDIDNYNV